jgi:hypothetical protein
LFALRHGQDAVGASRQDLFKLRKMGRVWQWPRILFGLQNAGDD